MSQKCVEFNYELEDKRDLWDIFDEEYDPEMDCVDWENLPETPEDLSDEPEWFKNSSEVKYLDGAPDWIRKKIRK